MATQQELDSAACNGSGNLLFVLLAACIRRALAEHILDNA